MSYLDLQGKFPTRNLGGKELLHKRMSRVPQQPLFLGASEKTAPGTLVTYIGLLLKQVVRSLILMARLKDAALTSLVINVDEVFSICVHSVSILCTSREVLVWVTTILAEGYSSELGSGESGTFLLSPHPEKDMLRWFYGWIWRWYRGDFLPCFACLINVLRCMSLYLKPGNWKRHRLKNENYCACGTSDGAGDEWPPTILVSVVCLSLSNWLLSSVCKKCSVNCSKCGSLFYIVHVPRAERFMFCQRCTWVDTIRLTILLSREGKISWVVL